MNFKNILIAASIACVFTSCVKSDSLHTTDEGRTYMPQAYQERSVFSLLKVDSAQEIAFGFYYTSFDGAPSDVTGSFEVDNSLIEQYNALHAYTGDVYEKLPEASYSLSETSTIVKKGKSASEPLSLIINPSTLIIGKKYLIPIKLVRVSSGFIDSALSVTYFRLNELTIRSLDFTSQGTLTGNNLNTPAAENLQNLTDNNIASKYLAINYTTDMYVQLAFGTAKKLDAYTITSANDAPERDPKTWILEGSNDGHSWVTVDTRTNESFSGRRQTRTFNLPAQVNFSNYRWRITANNGSNLIQIAEWRLLEYY